MRISDWSSDVCSSDLHHLALADPTAFVRSRFRNLAVERDIIPTGPVEKEFEFAPVYIGIGIYPKRHTGRSFLRPDPLTYFRIQAFTHEDRKSTRLNSSH